MLSKARLEQISEMEGILNEADAFLAEAEAFFEKWQNFLPKMEALERYYFNGDWREDYEAYEQGEIPPDLPCGVLGEDPIFNASVMQRELAVQWLKLISRILDNNKQFVKKRLEKRPHFWVARRWITDRARFIACACNLMFYRVCVGRCAPQCDKSPFNGDKR